MKKRFIIFYVATFCIVAGLFFVMPASSAILFYEDFEDALDLGLDGWWRSHSSGNGGSRELTTEQVRSGSKSCKFSLTRYTESDYREELTLRTKWNNGSLHFTIGNEYWIGSSIFLADGYHSPTERGVWGVNHQQFHSASDKPPKCDCTEGKRHPNLTIRTNDSKWASWTKWDPQKCTPLEDVGVQSKYYWYDPFSTGQWYDFVINVKWSYGADGFLKIWKNGVLIMDRTGGNCFNDDKGPFLKFGIYGGIDQDQTMTIYYDELRIGDSNSSYSEVAPGGSVKPLPPTSVRTVSH
jgi:hypothetical protein